MPPVPRPPRASSPDAAPDPAPVPSERIRLELDALDSAGAVDDPTPTPAPRDQPDQADPPARPSADSVAP